MQMSETSNTGFSHPRMRPGGRSERVRRAVLASTLNLMLDKGYALMTIPDIARDAGVHPTTIWRAIERGELAALRLGPNGNWRIRREALEAWLQPTNERVLRLDYELGEGSRSFVEFYSTPKPFRFSRAGRVQGREKSTATRRSGLALGALTLIETTARGSRRGPRQGSAK